MVINDSQPEYCVERVIRILNRQKKAINGAKILVVGVAYKQDINDYRESPAIKVIEKMENAGAEIEYYDPWVKVFEKDGKLYSSVLELTEQLVKGKDLIIITCGHTNIDYDLIQKNAKVVFDTKNVMTMVEDRDNIEVL